MILCHSDFLFLFFLIVWKRPLSVKCYVVLDTGKAVVSQLRKLRKRPVFASNQRLLASFATLQIHSGSFVEKKNPLRQPVPRGRFFFFFPPKIECWLAEKLGLLMQPFSRPEKRETAARGERKTEGKPQT